MSEPILDNASDASNLSDLISELFEDAVSTSLPPHISSTLSNLSSLLNDSADPSLPINLLSLFPSGLSDSDDSGIPSDYLEGLPTEFSITARPPSNYLEGCPNCSIRSGSDLSDLPSDVFDDEPAVPGSPPPDLRSGSDLSDLPSDVFDDEPAMPGSPSPDLPSDESAVPAGNPPPETMSREKKPRVQPPETEEFIKMVSDKIQFFPNSTHALSGEFAFLSTAPLEQKLLLLTLDKHFPRHTPNPSAPPRHCLCPLPDTKTPPNPQLTLTESLLLLNNLDRIVTSPPPLRRLITLLTFDMSLCSDPHDRTVPGAGWHLTRARPTCLTVPQWSELVNLYNLILLDASVTVELHFQILSLAREGTKIPLPMSETTGALMTRFTTRVWQLVNTISLPRSTACRDCCGVRMDWDFLSTYAAHVRGSAKVVELRDSRGVTAGEFDRAARTVEIVVGEDMLEDPDDGWVPQRFVEKVLEEENMRTAEEDAVKAGCEPMSKITAVVPKAEDTEAWSVAEGVLMKAEQQNREFRAYARELAEERRAAEIERATEQRPALLNPLELDAKRRKIAKMAAKTASKLPKECCEDLLQALRDPMFLSPEYVEYFDESLVVLQPGAGGGQMQQPLSDLD